MAQAQVAEQPSGLRRGRVRGFKYRLANRLTGRSDGRNHRPNWYVLTSFGHGERRDCAFVYRLIFHHRLVGFDLGQDVARLDRVTNLTSYLAKMPFPIVGVQPVGAVRATHQGADQTRTVHLDKAQQPQ